MALNSLRLASQMVLQVFRLASSPTSSQQHRYFIQQGAHRWHQTPHNWPHKLVRQFFRLASSPTSSQQHRYFIQQGAHRWHQTPYDWPHKWCARSSGLLCLLQLLQQHRQLIHAHVCVKLLASYAGTLDSFRLASHM